MSEITFHCELDPYEKKDGTHTIQIRITQLRKKRRISSGISVTVPNWNSKKEEVRKSDKLYAQKNAALQSKILQLQNEYLKGTASKRVVTAAGLISKVRREILGDSYLEYADRRIAQQKSPHTRKAQYSIIDKLREYLGTGKDLLFMEIDYEFLIGYLRHLEKLGNGPNTIHANFKTLKAIYNHAVKAGHFEPDRISPFVRISLKKEKSKRAKLSEKDILAIERLSIRPGINKYHSRNIFLFSFYTQGMRTADVLQLTWGQIKEDRLEYIARKTGKFRSIKLISRAKAILDLYRPIKAKATDWVFPFLRGKSQKMYTEDEWLIIKSTANSLINLHLKEIAKEIGVKSISMHVARHTFAEIARLKTSNIYAVSEALDHTSVSVTENYFKSWQKQENDDFSDAVYGE